MTYELTEYAKKELTWTEQKRVQLAQLLFNIAEVWILPDSLKD